MENYIMLKFADLSFSQKKFVVAVIEHHPEFKTNTQMTLKQVGEITQAWAKERANGAPKVGYPNWMFKANKIEKGLYQLPVPSDSELSDYQTEAEDKANPVKKARAKVAKLQSAKKVMINSNTVAIGEELSEDESRLQAIIGEDESFDLDLSDEDFSSILAEAGIEVGSGSRDYY
jgi:hypothetical protein